MKRILWLLVCVVMLAGCTGKRDELDRIMELRGDLLSSSPCTFDTVVTADYGDKTQEFTLSCVSEGENLNFTVRQPLSIAGITGEIDQENGEIGYDGTVLAFEPVAEGDISPVGAPWLFLKTLRSGFITSCNQEEKLLRVSADDSYADDAFHLNIWLDEKNIPVSGEILKDNRRILTLKIENFGIERKNGT